VASDRVEARNEFCTSCHLPDGTPLHQTIGADFDGLVPANLTGVHGRALLDEREDGAFRCIDCHGGTGAIGRTRVKLLSVFDGLRYAVGAFEEPDSMPWPLSDAVCAQCHQHLRNAPAPGWSRESFHAVGPHAELSDGPGCVDCHAVHEPGGDPFAYFLDRERVHVFCRDCHSDFARGG
jgi:hypothetical protein